MKYLKKALTLLLVLSMLLSMFVLPAQAEDSLGLSLGEGVGVSGSTVKIDLRIDGNANVGLSSLNATIVYPKDALTCTGVDFEKAADGTKTAWQSFAENASATPNARYATAAFASDYNVEDAVLPEGYSSDTYSAVKLACSAATEFQAEQSGVGGMNTNGVLASLTFTVNEGSTLGSRQLTLLVPEFVQGSGDVMDVSDALTNGTINIVNPGVCLNKSSVTVDGVNDASVTAKVYSATGADITSSVKWSVKYENASTADVSVAAGGAVTVKAKAKAGAYSIAASGTGVPTNGAAATLTVNREPKQLKSFSINGSASIAVPQNGESFDFTYEAASGFDQYGDNFTPNNVSWEIFGTNNTNAAVNAATGVVTLDPSDLAGTFTLRATAGNAGHTTFCDKVITVTKAAPKLTSVEVSGPAAVTIPTGDTPTQVTYTGTVLDQYGSPMTGAIQWSLSGSNLTGVSIDKSTGVLSVNNSAAAGTTFKVCGTSSKKVGELSVTLQSINFTTNTPPTTKDAPTYGDTWGEIVTNIGSYSATVGGTPIEGGTYSVLNADSIPDAGEQTYTIVYNNSDYQNVVAYTGNKEIAKAALTGDYVAEYDACYLSTKPVEISAAGFGLPDNAGVLRIKDVNCGDSKEYIASADTSSFALKSGIAASAIGQSETFTVTIESDNYEDVTATVRVKLAACAPQIAAAQEKVNAVTTIIPATQAEFDDETIYISVNSGKDVYSTNLWTTQKAVDTLVDAISVAVSKQTDEITLPEKDAATLEKAVQAFEKTCKNGSRVDCESFWLSASKQAVTLTEDAPCELAAGKSMSYDIVTDRPKTTEVFTLNKTEDGSFTAAIKGTKVTVTAAKNAASDDDAHFKVTSTSGKSVDIYAKVIVPTTKLTINNSQNSKSPTLTSNGTVETNRILLTANAEPSNHTDSITWSFAKETTCASLTTVDHQQGTTIVGNQCYVVASDTGSVTVQAMSGSGKKATVTIKIGQAATGVTTTLKSDQVNLAVGKKTALKATAAILDPTVDAFPYKAAKDKPINSAVVWSVEDNEIEPGKNVISLDDKGNITALNVGNCIVRATPVSGATGCGDLVFYVHVIVPTTKLTINNSQNNSKSPTLTFNGSEESKSIRLEAVADTGTEQEHTDSLTWSITKGAEFVDKAEEENGKYCYITAKDTVTTAGSVTVQVESGSGKKATVTIKIGQAATGVTTTMKSNEVGLIVGKKTALKATAAILDPTVSEFPYKAAKDKPISSEVVWSVENNVIELGKNVISLDAKGNVTALNVGECIVRATPVSGAAGCGYLEFTVKVTPVLKSFTLYDALNEGAKPPKLTFEAGQTVTLTEYVTPVAVFDGAPEDYDGYEITYTTKAKSAVATIDKETGALNCIGKGTASITVTITCGSQKKTATLSVTINA